MDDLQPSYFLSNVSIEHNGSSKKRNVSYHYRDAHYSGSFPLSSLDGNRLEVTVVGNILSETCLVRPKGGCFRNKEHGVLVRGIDVRAEAVE